MRITCPHCGRTSSTSKTIPQGATVRVKCPGCGQVFRLNEQGLEVLDATTTKAVSPSRVEPVETTPRHAPTAAPPVIKPDQVTDVRVVPGTPFQQVIQVAVPERQRTNPIGVAALVLGIIAALIAWVPFLGLVAIPVALLGALLGAIGLIYGLISRRGKVAASSIGLALCLGSVLLSVVMTGSVANQIGVAMKEAQQKNNRSAQPAIAAAPVVTDAKNKTIEARPASSPAPAISVQPAVLPAPVVETWLSPDQPGQLGNVQVRLSSVTLGRVVLRDRTPFPGRENALGESKDQLLSIVVEISNLDPNRKLDFKTFAGKQLSFERDNATLRDNFGNLYRGIDFGFSSLPEFGTISRHIICSGQLFAQFFRSHPEELPEAQRGQLQPQQAVRRLILSVPGPELV